MVADALEIFAHSDRDDFLPITDRLLDHEYAAVGAAPSLCLGLVVRGLSLPPRPTLFLPDLN